MSQVDYQQLPATFYLDHTERSRVGWLRARFHASRFRRLGKFVKRFWCPATQIADLGCGNCLWNEQRLAVTGVDINEKMMRWAKGNRYLQDYRICSDLSGTGLPGDAFHIVVMSETLEHLSNLAEVLAEVHRIIKDEGVFLITVPYDFFLSPFCILFGLHCLYQGYVKGSKYHRQRCGHIHHFSKRRLRRLLVANGFRVREMFVLNGLTIFAAAEKVAKRSFAKERSQTEFGNERHAPSE